MKFGKQIVSEMVPEWREAYMDYNYLKSLLEHIQVSNLRDQPVATLRSSKRKATLDRAFSGLTKRNGNSNTVCSTSNAHNKEGDIENQVIVVSMVESKELEGVYETNFLMSTEGRGMNELMFFKNLDAEFNKVNIFYKTKVEEVLKEATYLNKQMDALIAFRIMVENHRMKLDLSAELDHLSSGVAASASAISASTPSDTRTSGHESAEKVQKDLTKESETPGERNFEDSDEEKQIEFKKPTATAYEILNKVKINTTNGTPYSTIKCVLKSEKDRQMNFRKENLKGIEEQLKCAFIEFYRKLRLLKNYSSLNISAFSKILKKYDKISARTASKSYLNMVDSSFIGNSDEVTRLVERVEATFIKHFSNSNRRSGMNVLRLKEKKERHTTTFYLGLFTGGTIALLAALILTIHVRNILKKQGLAQYMENMFPLYSLFGFIVLHMFMYAGNIYFWRRYHVNYPFIFGFKQGTELGYRELLLLSTGLATLALASVLANLDMEMDEKTKDYQTLTELLPLALVTLVLLVTFCPLNIIYRSSRFFLLFCIFRCISAPLYKVTLPDFFLADQLTSQIQALRSLEFYICYYGWGDFKQRRNTCKSSDVYNTFNFIIATIPYWSRLLQCLRRLCEERDPMQGYNGLKYFSTVVAVLSRTAYSRQRGQMWWMLALISSTTATVFSTYWDLAVDWGLLQRHSKNRWLRDKLILPQKSVYFGVMVLNVVLRLAWLQTVLNFQVSFLHRETLIAIVASLEIIRRGIWNFFRLENEHLNNVGKYRAFNSVPLPFNYDEDQNEDE